MIPKFTAVFEECEEGGYCVTIREIPMIVTQGDTMEEAQENLLYALEDYASFLDHQQRQEHREEDTTGKRLYKPLSISF